MTREGKRISFFTMDSKPLLGGAAEYLHGLCEALGKAGFAVTVFSTANGCETYPTSRYSLKPLGDFPKRALGHTPGDGFFVTRRLNTLLHSRRLRRASERAIERLASGPAAMGAVVIAYWPGDCHFLCRACKEASIPYHLLCHSAELLGPLSGPAKDWRRDDVREAAGVVVSNRAAEAVIHSVAGRDIPCVIINPGIDTAPAGHVSPESLAGMRARLRLPQDARVILSIGRLVKRKGFDRVVAALDSLRLDFPRLYYLAAGDGPELKPLREQARLAGLSDRVIFMGRVSDAQKRLLYALSDLFVMPNRTLENGRDFEGFGIVFLEAALAGKPAIGGASGGVAEAIETGRTGLLVNPESPGELEAAIRHLLKHPDRMKAMGERARRRVLGAFSWDHLSREFGKALFRDAAGTEGAERKAAG